MSADLEARCFIKRGTTLHAADIHADDLLSKVKDGASVLVSVRRPRNIEHHRRLFALLNLTIENSDHWADKTVLLDDLKLATGLFQTRVSALNGLPYPSPASISFASMTQDRFEPWYAKAVGKLSEHLGMDVEAMLDALQPQRRRNAA